MTVDEIKELLRKAKDDPSVLEVETDAIDKLLAGVVRIEKKHLYGMEAQSGKKRREEILEFLEAQIAGGS